ncbi:MAG: prohibitin family protein [bacterium]
MPLIYFIIIAFVVMSVMSAIKKAQAGEVNVNLAKIRRNAKVIIFIVVAVLILLKSIVIIHPGQVGVVVFFGDVRANALQNGIHIINPLASVVRMSVRTEEYTMSIAGGEGKVKGDDAIDALTKEGLKVRLDLTGWYRLEASAAPKVYQTIGTDYEVKIVRPALRTAIRDAVVKYTAAGIYTEKRTDLVANIETVLSQLTKERGILIEKILLRNVILPKKLTEAIDAKQAAEQEAQQMEFVLLKEQKEQERKIIEAEGIKSANKIIASGLTPSYLQWYRIDMMKQLVNSPNNTIIFIPEDMQTTPIINIPAQ